MNPSEVALAALVISAVTLVGQGVNAWLGVRQRADLAEFELRLCDRLDGRYVQRPECPHTDSSVRARCIELRRAA